MDSLGRVSPVRRLVRVGMPAVVGLVLLTSCVSGGDGESGGGEDGGQGDQQDGGQSGDPQEVADSSLTTSLEGGSVVQFDVYPVQRIGNDMALLNMTATNTTEEGLSFFEVLSAGGSPTTAEGVSLVDTGGNDKYFPLRTGDDACHCSDWSDDKEMQPGDSIDFWVAFPAPPDDVSHVTVTTTASPDFLDIPLVDGEGEHDDIADADVGEPDIRPLSSYEDDEDDTVSREESGDESSIMLSSDVLFDVDESELTGEADETLEQVASEIDDSSAETVQIDGYTDDSGNDSINDPLSEDRAAAVQSALEDLVSRSGVSYEANGHGSADPVADNGSEEGKQKNRRVTVTFEN